MSNHSGSYMLNEVLVMFEQEQVFELLGRDRACQLVLKIVDHACQQYDCNSSEILDDRLDERLSICSYCLRGPVDLQQDGLCATCARGGRG